MSDPNLTIPPGAARAQTHVGKLTTTLKAIPAEKARQKIGRTIAGALMLAGGLFGGRWLKSADLLHSREIATAAVILGATMMSFEYVTAPIKFALAAAKDIANIVRGKSA